MMKINKLTLTVALIVAGILATPSAMAASASANIGPIEILAVAMKSGASITWTGDSTWSNSYAYTVEPSQTDYQNGNDYDWNTLLSTLANTSGASSSSSITPSAGGTSLLSAAQALLTNTASFDYYSYNYGSSDNSASRTFTTSGPMAIFISAPYSIFADPGTGSTGGYANASASLYLNYTASSGSFNSYSYSGTSDNVAACNGNWWCGANTGVMSASGDIDSGIVTGKAAGYGSFNTSTSANAYQQTQVVPVPAAAWLLGSGLIGLVAVGRRKEQA